MTEIATAVMCSEDVGRSHSSGPLEVEKGKGFAQGIFIEYGITEDDDCTSTRLGGFGSTDKKSS